MKTKLTLFVAVLAVALFGMGCASTDETRSSAKDLSLQGLIWTGYLNTGAGNIYTMRLERKQDHYEAYLFSPNNKEGAVPAFLYLKEITPEGRIVFHQAKSQTSGILIIYEASLIGDGNRIENGYTTADGKRQNDRFELIRVESRPKK
jgi:hypothetical protein